MSDINQAQSASTATFVTALVTNLIVFSAEMAAFTILRPQFKVIYAPRTYMPIARKRVAKMSKTLWAWPLEVYRLDYDDIRRQNGLDAYVFVRFLRMMVKILLPIWLISWAIPMPVDAVKASGGKKGLEMFTFGNVGKQQYARYAAHIILAYAFTFWILYVLKTEMAHYITVRQRHLIDPNRAGSAQASTVLITGIPPRYLEPAALRSMFKVLPGGIRNVWINRDLKEIPDLYDERLAALNKLESAETNLLNTAAKLELKKQKALAKGKTPPKLDVPSESEDPERRLALAEQHVPTAKRPTHRLKAASWLPFALPFTGKKVDTIEWAREEIPRLDEEVKKRQERYAYESAHESYDNIDVDGDGIPDGVKLDEEYPRLTSAFVRFERPVAAHMAAQVLCHHEPYRMMGKHTEVAPADVIWSNLNLNPYEAKIRTAISYAATAGLIILWAFPVAFVGAVSNVHALCLKASWLAWICKLPGVVVGIISGVLPPVALAVLMMLLPIVLRLLARFEGIPRYTGLELSLMTRFFIFQVIHSFLIVTISAGIINSLPGLLSNPSSIPSLLANNLPGASNFFLTYVLLQLSGIAGGFLQIVPLVLYYVKLFILGSTPRSVYSLKNSMNSVKWGTLFPTITLIAVVTFAYSIIAPVINGVSCAIFFLQFQLWKYLFSYSYDQPAPGDTGGLFFPKAVTHLFVGLYIEQICLAALFFLAQDNNKKPTAIPEGALMIVLIVITAGFHLILLDSYGPLLRAVPLSLVDRGTQERENESKQSIEGRTTAADPSGGADIEMASTASMRQRVGSKASGAAPSPIDEKRPLQTHGEGVAPTSTSANGTNDVAARDPKIPPGRGKRLMTGSNATDNGKNDDGTSLDQTGEDGSEGERKGNGLPPPKYSTSNDFTHPALGPARTVWIPRDQLGIAEEEYAALRAAGIDVSLAGATMTEKGTVDVTAPPPGEDPEENS